MLDGIFEVIPKQTFKNRIGKIDRKEHKKREEKGMHDIIEIDNKAVHLVPSRTDKERIEVTYQELLLLKELFSAGCTVHSFCVNDQWHESNNITELDGSGWDSLPELNP